MSTPALRLGVDPAFGPAGIAPGEVSGRGAGGPAPKRIIVGYGFWIFLLSDVIMFSAFFAAYAVLFKNTACGPSAHELFDLRNTAAQTAFLLASTFTCGMASLAVGHRSQKWTQVALLWLGTMMAQFYAKGFRQDIRHRFLCFSLFWHALDIIWVAIFNLVYLVGSLPPELLP